MSSADTPLISCLCITEDRADFMPWLLWNYDRQSWAHRELVVVDSSRRPFDFGERNDIRVIRAPYRSGVGQKRNKALEHAHGDIITWFDDDDWQHPEKLALLAKALQGGKPFAGCTESWFLDFARMRCSPYRAAGQRLLFNGIGVKTEAARAVRFPTHVKKASDTRWMQDLERKFRSRGAVVKTPLFFWLCHGTNLSNPANRRRFDRDVTQMEAHFGKADWIGTTGALQSLVERMGKDKESKNRIEAMSQMTNINENIKSEAAYSIKTRSASNTPVTAMVKATVLDAGYLAVMLPHMLKQAKYPFAERIVVVDPRREFEGKYRARFASSRRELDQVLSQLMENDEIDRVIEVPYDQATIEATNRRYFGRSDVPTHASSGGPIYPTLWGLEQAATDHVLQFDADIFFHSGDQSWVRQALACMQADSRLWLMMTHPGPPAGPVGRSIRGANTARCRWDDSLQTWRFTTATTRYFLCDRRRLHGCLQAVLNENGCAPLEQCISRTLKLCRAYRGALGNLASWHLHAWSHAQPFPDWASRIAECVSEGKTPASQRGKYDLRLDQPSVRADWQHLIEGPVSRANAYPASKSSHKEKASVDITANDSESDKTAVVNKDTVAPVLSIVIPIRNRAGQRVRNALRGLAWQDTDDVLETILVSHGSREEIDAELEKICEEYAARLIITGKQEEPWNKPVALNTGIRATSVASSYVMTMDADMILLPSFAGNVLSRLRQDSRSMVLCRSSDLPEHASLPRDGRELYLKLEALHQAARLRPAYGCGGIQAASRGFFFEVRGYDEDLCWWGAMDSDMVQRAKLAGMRVHWIEDRTGMLHQWHPRKHANLDNSRQISDARRAWQQNHALVKSRSKLLQRNSTTAWEVA